ncbi:MAG: alkane 1-monooxygenase [Alphaproteobacteria bacterium]
MWRYSGPFFFLGSIPLLHAWSPAAPFLTIALLLAVLIGAEFITSSHTLRDEPTPGARFRWLPMLYVGAQIAVTAWAIVGVSSPHSTPFAFLALLFSVGIVSGVFGMLTAHELVHSHSTNARLVGATMLTAMIYGQFRISHIYGHHRWAATARDSSTAWRGESFYAFLLRTVPAQFKEAWRFEHRSCRTRGLAWYHNRIHLDLIITFGLYALIFALTGAVGLLFFILQAAIAVIVLELFNYIAHYGLMRHSVDQRFEPLGDEHSWNSSNALANLVIFNMGRHSDHHRHPARSYERLTAIAGAPELPAGYAYSILLALVPPLWHRLMDAKLDSLAESESHAKAAA